MKKITSVIVASALLLVPAFALAAEFRLGNQPGSNSDERIANDVYMAGGSVTSAAQITGDVIAGGGNVVISGTVSGDILAGGGNITILSNVGDDVRAGGGNIVIQGRIGGDAIIGGGQITLGGPGVGGDIAIGGGSVRIDAPVGGKAKIGGGEIYINAPMQGDIEIEADKLTLGSKAVITGHLTYTASKELTTEDGATVTGEVTFTPRESKQVPAAALAALLSVWYIGKFLSLFVCSFSMFLLFKRYGKTVLAKATDRPLLELGRGVLVLAATPVISVLLFITLLGIPFGILGLIGYVALLLVSWIMSPVLVGGVVYHYFSKSWEISWKTILLGAFVYSVVGVIPVLGWLIQTGVLLIALGSIVAVKIEAIREWR